MKTLLIFVIGLALTCAAETVHEPVLNVTIEFLERLVSDLKNVRDKGVDQSSSRGAIPSEFSLHDIVERISRLESLQGLPVQLKFGQKCNVKFPENPDKYPEIHEKDDNRQTPLHRAAQSSTFEEVCQLLEKGADPNSEDGLGENTPLFFAVTYNPDIEVARLLLEKGADVNWKNKIGRTPLHFAAKHNPNANVTELLLNKGAHLNSMDSEGYLPIHLAAWYNPSVEVTRLLLEKGADPNAKDHDAWTPYKMSENNPNSKVQYLLKKYGARTP